MNYNEINASFFRKTKARVGAAFLALTYVANATALFASEASEGAPGDPPNPLDFRGDLAFWTAIVFFLLLVIMSKFAFGPIVKALDQREKNEAAKMEAAERANADAKELLELYRQKIADSEEEIRQMIAEAKDSADAQASSIVEGARIAASQERARALKDIQAASDVALQEIAAKSAELATNLAGKIIQEQIDPDRHARLIQNALDDLTS